MPNRQIAALSLAVVLSCAALRAQDEVAHPAPGAPPILAVGAPAPDFNLPGIVGKLHNLAEYRAAKVLVIVFTCNHCPVAQMYEKRIKQLTADYRDRGVAVVAINPNDPGAVRYSEMGHTDVGDTLAEMKVRADYRHFNFPYLSHGANQSVSLKYGPTATPHAFIFDDKRILRYQGRLDSSQREELVTVLLSPEGEILYRVQGAINPIEVRRTILKYLPDDHYIGTHAYWNSVF